MRLTFHIIPTPKGRPKFNAYTKRAYTPVKSRTYEESIRKLALQQLGVDGDYPIHEKGVPLAIDIDFLCPRPKASMRKKDPEGLLWNPKGYDVDNLTKSILDALNGVLWDDDRQIVQLRTRKMLHEKDKSHRVCLFVYPCKEEPTHTCETWDDPDLGWEESK